MTKPSRFAALRLQTRLRLAFAAVAALPLIVVPLVIHSVTESFDRSFAQALDDAAAVVSTEFARAGEEVARRTSEVAPAIAAHVALLSESDPALLLDGAEAALTRSGLDVLTVLDADGRVLLSGHLPARVGDLDARAAALLERAGAPVLGEVEVKDGDRIRRAEALLAATRVSMGPVAGIVGGRRFSAPQLERLGALVRGRVTLEQRGAAEEEPVARRTLSRLFGLEHPLREVPIAGDRSNRVLRIRVPDEALVEAKARIALGALGAFALALVAGVFLARLLARRLVEPVEALVTGTRELAKGELGHRVDVAATGELAQLVSAFNGMSQELARSRDRLARAERVAAWEQIARALAHEIKNPLTPIAMAIETLQRTHARAHPEFDRFFREGTATVLEEVERLRRLATEFGEFARWPKPMATPATPAELLGHAASLYGARPEHLRLDVELEPDLPEVNVDRDQLQRALVNLVKNAIEAMPGGGRIVLRARGVADGVALEVADTGPGFAADTRAKLFEPYFTTKVEGTGLGLAIVQRIVAEHDGRIEADETPGGGATFRITLPALATRAAA